MGSGAEFAHALTEEHCKTIAKVHAFHTILADKIPKNPNRYLFIGRNGGEFSGNTKYLFLHFVRNVPQAESWFVTQHRNVFRELTQAGLPVLFYPSDGVEQTLAQCGTVVVESISFRNYMYYPLIAGARQVQLWHGVGNKKIGFQLQGAACLEGRDQTLMEDHSDYDIIVSTSPFYTEKVFKISMTADQFVSLGYPRTDIFFRRPDKDVLIGCNAQAYARVVKAGKKKPVILFSPTFRDSGVNPLTQDDLDLAELFDTVLRLDAHLLIKPHTRTMLEVATLPDHVTVCDPASDIYPFLPHVDVMITDYSSIHTEYLLLDRPILFFWADFDSYMDRDRGFQFPFEPMCPGPKCRSGRELLQAIEDAVNGRDEWKTQRAELRDLAFSHTEGGACERLAELLLENDGSSEHKHNKGTNQNGTDR